MRLAPLALLLLLAAPTLAEDPDIPHALARADCPGLDLRLMHTTFFLGRERLLTANRNRTAEDDMALWRDRLFKVMSGNAENATSFFGIPPNRVVELGAQVEL